MIRLFEARIQTVLFLSEILGRKERAIVEEPHTPVQPLVQIEIEEVEIRE